MGDLCYADESAAWCGWCYSYHSSTFDCKAHGPKVKSVTALIPPDGFQLVVWKDYGGRVRISQVRSDSVVDGQVDFFYLRETMVVTDI